MAEDWWAVEVLNARTIAAVWRDAYGEALVESAVTNRALGWEWHAFGWGVVFEVRFADEGDWEAWRRQAGVCAALDAVPDPVGGLLVHRGRGGACGGFVPRRPGGAPGAAAVALPEPAPAGHAAGQPLVDQAAAMWLAAAT
jgi:hypothetical protein